MLAGTAGWSLPKDVRDHFGPGTSLLQRYATLLPAVEINTSFYRPHRPATYERWAAAVPNDFRFSVKLPKLITHERRLQDCRTELERFAGEVAGLGPKLGAVLVQLPPSLIFDPTLVHAFFKAVRKQVAVSLVCEPRHASWFDGKADAALHKLGVARVAADPAIAPGADQPGGAADLVYVRMHGSPEIYRSDYEASRLVKLRNQLRAHLARGRSVWCIFDNTTFGHATGNALAMLPIRKTPKP
ncbi:hypothetical protein sos41_39740 [Alphaproteobacteria bacterium SO-S41]|nr:hypothetical protein sos41_39740 [Alphaproteobacteria bacterium SO-S41]